MSLFYQQQYLASCALELSEACEPEVFVQLVAFWVERLPHGHV